MILVQTDTVPDTFLRLFTFASLTTTDLVHSHSYLTPCYLTLPSTAQMSFKNKLRLQQGGLKIKKGLLTSLGYVLLTSELFASNDLL